MTAKLRSKSERNLGNHLLTIAFEWHLNSLTSHISRSHDITTWQDREEQALSNVVQIWTDLYFGSRTRVCRLQDECRFEYSVFCSVFQLGLCCSVQVSIVRAGFYRHCLAGKEFKKLDPIKKHILKEALCGIEVAKSLF